MDNSETAILLFLFLNPNRGQSLLSLFYKISKHPWRQSLPWSVSAAAGRKCFSALAMNPLRPLRVSF